MISTVSDLIAQVESGGNPWAVRFEPAHTPSEQFVNMMVTAAKCSEATARVLCATSWGLYQIMGDELMALGLKMSPLQYCASTQTQNDYFTRFLFQKGLANYSVGDIIGNDTDRNYFASRYNGPGNISAYSSRLLSVYQASA